MRETPLPSQVFLTKELLCRLATRALKSANAEADTTELVASFVEKAAKTRTTVALTEQKVLEAQQATEKAKREEDGENQTREGRRKPNEERTEKPKREEDEEDQTTIRRQ